MDCAAAGTLRQCRATDHHWTGPVQPGFFALQELPNRGRKADAIPGRIFQHHQSPQLRPAQHEYFFVAYDSQRHCGSDYRNGDDGAADTIGPEAHLLTVFSGWLVRSHRGQPAPPEWEPAACEAEFRSG